MVNYIQFKKKNFEDIRTHSFDHSIIYRYRLATNKLASVPNSLSELILITIDIFSKSFIQKNGFRASNM